MQHSSSVRCLLRKHSKQENFRICVVDVPAHVSLAARKPSSAAYQCKLCIGKCAAMQAVIWQALTALPFTTKTMLAPSR